MRAGTEDLDTVLRGHPSYGVGDHAQPLRQGRAGRRSRARGPPVRAHRRRHGQLRAASPALRARPRDLRGRPPGDTALQDRPTCALRYPRAARRGARGPRTSARRASTRRSQARPFAAIGRPSSRGSGYRPTSRARPTSRRSRRSHPVRPPGSEPVFSYIDQSLLESDDAPSPMQRARALVASVGEPWVSGFDPDQIGSDLRRAGTRASGGEPRPRRSSARATAAVAATAFIPAPALDLAHARVSS